MATPESTLLTAITDRTARIGIMGLGYVGLPLADAFIRAGFKVLGFDVDPAKVEKLMVGRSYIGHIPDERITDWVNAGHFEATADMSRLAEPDAVLICVPTPLTDSRDPDLSYVEQTTRFIAEARRGVAVRPQLIVLESTTYPGTTRDLMLPILEGKDTADRQVVGTDFFLAYSPEREDPGNPDYAARSIPKVVGGIDDASLRVADALYNAAVVETVPVRSCEVAEACKILENTYRSVNIAMINELKMLYDRMGIDVWEVIDAAKTKPFGFQAFYPGPGLGGHCIPIDPFYLSWIARKHGQPTRFIELAGEINHHMPEYVITRVMEALNDAGKPVRGSHIGILGMAYKKNVDDPRESPSFRLLELLAGHGAKLSYSDPHIARLPKMRSFDVPNLASQPLTPDYLASLDLALIATDHDAFNYDLICEHAKIVVDTRNALKDVKGGKARVVKA